MRALLVALLLAAGVGLFAPISSASAAPANGVTINETANANSAIVHVQHWRWGSRARRGGCHTRPWSRWRARCWM